MEVFRFMREVLVSYFGKEYCRKDMCLLRRNYSVGLWRVVSRGCGVFVECSRFFGLRLRGEGIELERISVFLIKVYL